MQEGEGGDVHPSARSSLQYFTPGCRVTHDAQMKDLFKDLNLSMYDAKELVKNPTS